MKVNPLLVVPRKLYNEALKAVNAVRVLAGKKPLFELPSGRPGHADSCPLLYALAPVGVERVYGATIEGQILMKDGAYDLGSDTFTGVAGVGNAKVDLIDADMMFAEVEKLRDVAGVFVDAFDHSVLPKNWNDADED